MKQIINSFLILGSVVFVGCKDDGLDAGYSEYVVEGDLDNGQRIRSTGTPRCTGGSTLMIEDSYTASALRIDLDTRSSGYGDSDALVSSMSISSGYGSSNSGTFEIMASGFDVQERCRARIERDSDRQNISITCSSFIDSIGQEIRNLRIDVNCSDRDNYDDYRNSNYRYDNRNYDYRYDNRNNRNGGYYY